MHAIQICAVCVLYIYLYSYIVYCMCSSVVCTKYAAYLQFKRTTKCMNVVKLSIVTKVLSRSKANLLFPQVLRSYCKTDGMFHQYFSSFFVFYLFLLLSLSRSISLLFYIFRPYFFIVVVLLLIVLYCFVPLFNFPWDFSSHVWFMLLCPFEYD